MKILLLQLTGRGGTQLYVSQLANSLSKKNEVTLLLGSYLFDRNQYQDSDVKIVFVDTNPSYIKMILKLFNPWTYIKIFMLISHENPDVVHLVLEDMISGIIFLLLKIKKYKLILTEHDTSPHKGEKLIETCHVQFTKYLVRSVSDRIIVHGNNLKKDLIGKGVPEKKIKVIPHGDYTYYLKWAKNIEEEQNSVLFFGRILDYKGLDYLINAVPTIASAIPNVKIIIAGSGDFTKYSSMIHDQKFFEIHNRFIQDEEVAEFFQRSCLVALPYIDGSQSGVIPIAYAFKKPVIVTNVGSLPEIVENEVTGFLIPPKNSNALAEAVIKIFRDDNLRMKMGENGYLKMKNELSWNNIADKTIEVYKQL
ncbi:glycosyl transferase, group 1 [Methanosarcina lacustris Z-7289]|uniref:Glycosyl transferase, group 1 n=1 Tax=Methanosarcina lacustris Z-7289 TaxID=1434111 RepID=A0A0E3S983_9EURY|nr:glycosyltransferase family 4 protein [Methanosarcina lacustris]AKB76152.1 glycosyl transferase, group 1 [Methanosarcina lacustris Z-7289]